MEILLREIAAVLLFICIASSNGEKINSPMLSALVPRIDQPNFKLNADGQHYNLYIGSPDGSVRSENAELRAPGTSEEELFVSGTISGVFDVGTAITIYEAGRNGYTVKFKFYGPGTKPTYEPFYVSTTGLKTAAG